MQTEPAILDAFYAAIAARRPLAVWYERPGRRTVHPHALFATPASLEHVNVFQVDGPTSPGSPLPGWRNFDLRRVERVEPLDGRFEVREDFEPDSSKYHRLLAFVR